MSLRKMRSINFYTCVNQRKSVSVKCALIYVVIGQEIGICKVVRVYKYLICGYYLLIAGGEENCV